MTLLDEVESGAHRIVVVSHDAGGAEVLAAWLAARPHLLVPEALKFALAGPAIEVFCRLLAINTRDLQHDDSVGLLTESDSTVLLTTTSWSSDLEHLARQHARSRAIPSASMMDHWCNIRARFEWSGGLVLPDEMWVTDSSAAELVAQEFPLLPVVLTTPDHVERFTREVQSASAALNGLPSERTRNVLFIGENISRSNRAGPESAEVVFFTDLLALTHVAEPLRVRIRPHPSESVWKYIGGVSCRERQRLKLHASRPGTRLGHDVAWADCVIGISSMALYLAACAGIPVGTLSQSSWVMAGIPIAIPDAISVISGLRPE